MSSRERSKNCLDERCCNVHGNDLNPVDEPQFFVRNGREAGKNWKSRDSVLGTYRDPRGRGIGFLSRI